MIAFCSLGGVSWDRSLECHDLLDRSFDDKLLLWIFPYRCPGVGDILAGVAVTSLCGAVAVVFGIGQLLLSVG